MATPDASTFSLPLTGLSVEGRDLVKRDPQAAAVIARIPLELISQIDLVRATSLTAIIFCLGFSGAAGAAWTWIEMPVLRWIIAGLMGAGALVALVGSRSLILHVRSQDGPVRFVIHDPDDHAEGFLVTLKGMRRSLPG